MIVYSNGIFWKLRVSVFQVQYKSMTAYSNGIFFLKQNKIAKIL